MSNLSRRSLVSSAAALPALAVPAVALASVEPDPIYAAIEEYRHLHELGDALDDMETLNSPELRANVEACIEARELRIQCVPWPSISEQ
jgi:hypothetical protein